MNYQKKNALQWKRALILSNYSCFWYNKWDSISYYHLVASFYKVLRESIPRQVDKKSGILKEEQGVWGFWRGDRGPEFSKRRKGQTFFSFLSLESHKTFFFSIKMELVITQQTNQIKLYAKDYLTTMYPAWGQFLLLENILTNPVILKCLLWEWVLVHFISVLQCLTLCDPMNCSTPGLPVLHQLLEIIQTHVPWLNDAIQTSHPLSSHSPLSQHKGLLI